MSNHLKITTYYKGSSWVIESEIDGSSAEDFPREVFLWTVNRDGSLKEFQAIGNIDQVARYPKYSSDRSSNFGIHLVRSDSSKQTVHSEEDMEKVVVVLKKAFDRLNDGYNNASTPIEEIYP